MKEIKLTKRYPNSRTEDIVDAYMRGWNDALDAVQNGKFHIADRKTEPQKWETPPKFEHKGITTTCVGVPMALIEDEPPTDCAWK